MDPLVMFADPGDTVIATFSPRCRENLRLDAIAAIGWRGEWLACWRMNDDEMFPGQLAWSPRPTEEEPFIWFGWVPSEDLADIKSE